VNLAYQAIDRSGRHRLHTRQAVPGAMVYPCLLTVVSISVLVLLLVFVVPRFAEMFASLSAPLPSTTKALIAVSNALQSYWWVLVGVLAAGGMAFKQYVATPAGRGRIDRLLVRMPLVAFVAISMFMPLFDITATAGGG